MTPKEFAKKWFSAIDAKNYTGLKNMLADNHQFHNPVVPQAMDREGHINMMQTMLGAFSNGEHHIEQLISEGDWVVVRGRWTGKHTGDFNGIPATGKTVDFTITDILHVVNDRLAEEYMEWNLATLLSQVGAMPQPA